MPEQISFKVAIAEDDPQYAKELQDNLTGFESEHNVCFSVETYGNGVEFLEKYQGTWDLVFLDIDMPGMNGMEAARDLRAMDSEVMIIFVTSLAQYAIQGYSVGAFDYILKPCSRYELDMKLQLALRQLSNRSRQSLMIKQDGDVYKVPVAKIYYVEINSHKLCYYTELGNYELSSVQTLGKLEQELEPLGFVRCNKGTLINSRHIDSIEGDCIYIGTHSISVSRSHRKAVMQKLLAMAKGGGHL